MIKLGILIVCWAAVTLGTSLENINLVNIQPIEKLPGFWDGRENLKPKTLNQEGSQRITNGTEASPGQFPHMAFILMNLLHSGHFFCGASLISESRALTAVSLNRITIIKIVNTLL